VEPPSLAEKSKSAEAEVVGSPGPASIVVWGAAVSIVNVRTGPVSVFPAPSVARTWAV
jgi:hypothetical protein